MAVQRGTKTKGAEGRPADRSRFARFTGLVLFVARGRSGRQQLRFSIHHTWRDYAARGPPTPQSVPPMNARARRRDNRRPSRPCAPPEKGRNQDEPRGPPATNATKPEQRRDDVSDQLWALTHTHTHTYAPTHMPRSVPRAVPPSTAFHRFVGGFERGCYLQMRRASKRRTQLDLRFDPLAART